MKLFLFLVLFPLMEALWLPSAKDHSEIKVSDQTDCLKKTIWATSCNCLYSETLNNLYNFESCRALDREKVESECGDSSYRNLTGRCRHFSRLCSKETANDGNACRLLNRSDDLTPCECSGGNCHRMSNKKSQEKKRMKNCCLAIFFCQLARSSQGGDCYGMGGALITFENADNVNGVIDGEVCSFKK